MSVADLPQTRDVLDQLLRQRILILDGAANNTVGGTGAGQRNTIAFNGGPGVSLFASTGNILRGNVLSSARPEHADYGVVLIEVSAFAPDWGMSAFRRT